PPVAVAPPTAVSAPVRPTRPPSRDARPHSGASTAASADPRHRRPAAGSPWFVVRTLRQGVFGAGGGSVLGLDPGPAAGGGVGGCVVILRSITFSASSFSVNCWIARW